ncbi:MAG: response regulator transcription factor [Oscillospiraceae bacterium]|nr:response regulator transcription factor [Oscillospiraceae bacterium]
MARIYLVEDDDNIRKLICYALSKEGHDIIGFPTPSEFWEEYRLSKPELILLDIMLPEEDGLSILKKVRAESDMPVIMLTAKGSEFDKVTGLDLGADDYITKPFGMTELSSRVRAVLRRSGKAIDKSTEYNVGNVHLDSEKHTVRVGDEPVSLSFKEYSILLMLLQANGKVVGREELLNHIWGEYYGESRTLDVHIRTLRQKLGESGSLIQTVKKVGYRIGE